MEQTMVKEGELPDVIVPLLNGSVCSGWCDKDEPNRLDCGDYLLVEVDGRQAFYAETADLCAMDLSQLRRELKTFIDALKQAAGASHV